MDVTIHTGDKTFRQEPSMTMEAAPVFPSLWKAVIGSALLLVFAVPVPAQPVAEKSANVDQNTFPAARLNSGGAAPSGIYPRQLQTGSGLEIRDRNNSNPPGAAINPNRVVSPPPVTAQPPRTGPEQIGYEFETLVEHTAGQKVPLFGHNAFNEGRFGVSPSDLAAPADYVLGPGDELAIRAWGQIDIDVIATVSREGSIFLPKVGVVHIAGRRADQLERALRGAIGKYFRNFELSASLTQLRAVSVYVTGHARAPGLHRVPALSTFIHAVFAVGAPTRQGDMRRIELKRVGKTVASMDLYKFLVHGDKTGDVPIVSGDVIHIPPSSAKAAIIGSVKTQGIYQISPSTTLGELLEFSGGLTTSGSKSRLVIERTNRYERREVIELRPGDEMLSRPMQDGDLVSVLPKSPRLTNSVTLRGNVATPIRGAWQPGLRVSDLIPDARALIYPAYWINRNRQTGLNMLYEPTHQNEVRPTLKQINWEYAVIERIDPNTLTPNLIPFNLGKAVRERDDRHDLALQPGDTVTIFSLDDFIVRQEQRRRYVRVEGEVGRAGMYQLLPGETLEQLLTRIGGLTDESYLYGLVLKRESVKKFQQQRMDETVLKLEQEAYRLVSLNAHSTSSEEQSNALPVQLEALRSLIDRLKAVRATGRVVLEVPRSATQVSSLPNYPLKDGDTVIVPAQPSVISVVGAVYQEGPILHKEGRTVSDYVRLAGGPTDHAYDEPPIVLKADGSIIVDKDTGAMSLFKSVWHTELMPGDTIVVRENLDQIRLSKIILDWTRVIYQFGIGAASLAILRGL